MPKGLGPSRGPKLGPRAQKYEVGRVLGRGAFGTAFFAEHRETARFCVLKRVDLQHMDTGQCAEALNECAVLEKLKDYPFIISVHEHWQELGRLWIAMEFADGGDLAQRVEAQRRSGAPFDEARRRGIVQVRLVQRMPIT